MIDTHKKIESKETYKYHKHLEGHGPGHYSHDGYHQGHKHWEHHKAKHWEHHRDHEHHKDWQHRHFGPPRHGKKWVHGFHHPAELVSHHGDDFEKYSHSHGNLGLGSHHSQHNSAHCQNHLGHKSCNRTWSKFQQNHAVAMPVASTNLSDRSVKLTNNKVRNMSFENHLVNRVPPVQKSDTAVIAGSSNSLAKKDAKKDAVVSELQHIHPIYKPSKIVQSTSTVSTSEVATDSLPGYHMKFKSITVAPVQTVDTVVPSAASMMPHSASVSKSKSSVAQTSQSTSSPSSIIEPICEQKVASVPSGKDSPSKYRWVAQHLKQGNVDDRIITDASVKTTLHKTASLSEKTAKDDRVFVKKTKYKLVMKDQPSTSEDVTQVKVSETGKKGIGSKYKWVRRSIESSKSSPSSGRQSSSYSPILQMKIAKAKLVRAKLRLAAAIADSKGTATPGFSRIARLGKLRPAVVKTRHKLVRGESSTSSYLTNRGRRISASESSLGTPVIISNYKWQRKIGSSQRKTGRQRKSSDSSPRKAYSRHWMASQSWGYKIGKCTYHRGMRRGKGKWGRKLKTALRKKDRATLMWNTRFSLQRDNSGKPTLQQLL